MKKRKVQLSVLLLVIIAGLYVFKKYTTYKEFIDNDKLYSLSDMLSDEIIGYILYHQNADILSQDDFAKMIDHLNVDRETQQISSQMFNSCFGIKYHKESEFFLFYICGEDNKVSSNNISIHSDPLHINYSESKLSFIEYLFSSKDYDVVLFAYKKPD